MKTKLEENGAAFGMSEGGGRAALKVVGGKGLEKMAGVWLGHRTTFGLGNLYGSVREGATGKRCPTLTEERAKKYPVLVRGTGVLMRVGSIKVARLFVPVVRRRQPSPNTKNNSRGLGCPSQNSCQLKCPADNSQVSGLREIRAETQGKDVRSALRKIAWQAVENPIVQSN